MNPRGPAFDEHRRGEIATRHAMMARDAGLARISSVTRWMVAGVVGLSGALALVAASAFHGRTVPSTTTTTATQSQATTQQTTATQTSAATTQSQAALSQSSQAPATTPAAPVVVSGGS